MKRQRYTPHSPLQRLALRSLVLAWVAFTPATVDGLSSRSADFILFNPFAATKVLIDTLYVNGRYYFEGFFGILGRLDTRHAIMELRPWTFDAARINDRFPTLAPGERYFAQIGLLGRRADRILTCFLALYLTWTPVGRQTGLGVQGRYLPALLAFAPALAGCRSHTSKITTTALGLVLPGAAIWLPIETLSLGLRFYF